MLKEEAHYRILVVEDNPGDSLLVSEYLEESFLNLSITQATNFKQAEALLIEHKDAFSTILLDLSLPDKDGEELLQQMQQLAHQTPIIILTGYADFQFAIKALALGASDYLLKDELSATILYKSIIYTIERNRSILKIKDSEQRYADLFHLSPIPMWVFDVDTLAFLDVNMSTVNHYGYSYQEFLSMRITDIRTAYASTKLYRTINEDLRVNNIGLKGVFEHIKKNGERIQVDITSNPLIFNGRNAKVVLSHDITDRLATLKAVEVQNQKLKEIAWLQSHMVRAPLARMMGLMNMILDDTVSPEEHKEFIQLILGSAHELDGIIKNVVDKSQQIDM